MHKRKQILTNVEPLLLTIPQVGAMLGLGHSKVYDLIRQEGLPIVKFGTAVRVPAEELKVWVKQRIAWTNIRMNGGTIKVGKQCAG